MDDRQLQQLLRMAVEAERLEGPAATGLRLSTDRGAVGGRVLTGTEVSEHPVLFRRERSWWRSGGMLAAGALLAAACIGVAFIVVNPGPGFTPPVAPGPVVDADPLMAGAREPAAPEATTRLANAEREEQAVLFAVYRGADGSCGCVQVNEPDWGEEKRLADVSRHELVRAGLQDSCMAMAPEVVIIGVAGRPGTVPTSRHHAETIARRLGDAPLRGRDVSSVAYAALPDLPAGTMVVAEKVSIGP